MSVNVVKVERVDAPQRGNNLWVDLLFDKKAGLFFARVGGKRIEAKSKDEAVALTKEALRAVTQVEWREVILIRVRDRAKDEADVAHENNRPVFSSSCSFTYLRRERATNPLKPKETIERLHREDFEIQVRVHRKHEEYFGYGAADKKKRGDEAERGMREDRAALAHVEPVWDHFEKTTEYELPYSPEAWAGIERIAQALRDTQAKLDEFAAVATPKILQGLAVGPLRLTNGKLEP